MTLLVGIRCSEDAVVLAADGSATFGSIAGQTVKQPTRKISIVAPTAAIATSGPVGLGQRLAGELSNAEVLAAIASMAPWEAMTFLRTKFFTHIGMELNVATQAKALGQAAFASALSHTLVAVMVKGSPRLFQFDQQGAPEEATPSLPWVTCGSGQGSADAFLFFLRKVFWPNREPTLQEALFTALWTVVQGIEAAPAGIGGDPQVVVLRREAAAEELSQAVLQEHRQSIVAAEQALADFRKTLAGSNGPTIPPAPGS